MHCIPKQLMAHLSCIKSDLSPRKARVTSNATMQPESPCRTSLEGAMAQSMKHLRLVDVARNRPGHPQAVRLPVACTATEIVLQRPACPLWRRVVPSHDLANVPEIVTSEFSGALARTASQTDFGPSLSFSRGAERVSASACIHPQSPKSRLRGVSQTIGARYG